MDFHSGKYVILRNSIFAMNANETRVQFIVKDVFILKHLILNGFDDGNLWMQLDSKLERINYRFTEN